MRSIKLYLTLSLLIIAQSTSQGQTIEELLNYRGIDEPNIAHPNQVEYSKIHHNETAFFETELIERYQSLRFLKSDYEIPNQILEKYRITELDRIRDDLAQTAKNLNPADPGFRVIEMDFRLIHLDSNRLSVIAHSHVYAGGAYGAIRHKAFNFIRKENEWKNYDPLTDDSDPTTLRKQILDQLNLKGFNGEYFAKTWPDVTAPETRPFQVVELPDEYYLLFQRYTVTTGVHGSIVIRLSKTTMTRK
ncbi:MULTISPECIES: hypothetical protein [unclassified Lentimonas]|uniref:hypothetical protein n=1 Tax=unclassified Lentimonas TaxID=2630993 RepID=UPI001322D94B|nr:MULTISPECIES: hypothetical protein [unclassified Lentimonas]CAA6679301.1 Unannotated [Lentimonas sp. CC4]CAA6686337.1 Unannotated [Lentimonas sp. CC6]CAA7076112.1 Unannotated [Lentimonas sp. CC4]CAA7170895.1 Unannotated [Lentimonas sp. CC21]CAA7181163.1 Unannotated [Lentimonas sp. CC8]